ncbi:cytochrome c oxidase subunit II [Psychrosphaera sp. B3R10]|uniref:cytochrome c oxidase subunit II n=1 Tax=unclassified Psychrosphaera TaxID=2641570 RepID=UPI001C088788|nr:MULTISPECIES: cytochrome c oxidase subunit II [unclassified Psychrosphaera]MBU2883382.1 cytochrome c oxidase subunit II [Psychrosphaera sp. I2R16]MBU2990524.1 cytochrome c oxidase subunit II [Psychrosphaera sp. B3R10]MDO6719002.1 cytochrome c oxidase subunit II [Psychrosphaera sp. 1_MG-2023]
MPLNLTKGVTEISRNVYDLHMIIFYICCVIGAVVFGIMFWSMLYHRKSKGVAPANFHESTKVEILWTAIPFVILIAMAFPATKTLIAMEDTSKADLTVQVTGSQWKWHYKYFDHELEYYSLLATTKDEIYDKREKSVNYLLEVDRPLVIPTGQKVRFLITSDDVIHSWWVPEFAIKKDANPGFINEAWTRVDVPGIYRGQCAELCGKDHGFMPVVVIAKEPAEFDKWVSEQVEIAKKAKEEEQKLLAMNMSFDELMAHGEKAYNANCAACHQPNGQGIPGVFPALKGSAIAIGDLGAHIDIVVNGKPGTAMQGYGKQLGLKDLAAIITYERNAWGNSTGDAVQAAEVIKYMSGQ